MQETVLKVGDANVRQKDAVTTHTESVGLPFREPLCQPAGINSVRISRQTHTCVP